jgi:hypothetical protein
MGFVKQIFKYGNVGKRFMELFNLICIMAVVGNFLENQID